MDDKSIQNKIDKIFPEYFDRFELPDGAREEAIMVYRACRSGKCDKDSFMSSFEERGFELNPLSDSKDPGEYSLSSYEKPTHVKRYASMISDMKVPYIIAIGYTAPRHGVVQRTKERKKVKNSHVDWWLYKDARPYEEFEIIDNFEEHLHNYKSERDGIK